MAPRRKIVVTSDRPADRSTNWWDYFTTTLHGAQRTVDRFGRPDAAILYDGVDDFAELQPIAPWFFESPITWVVEFKLLQAPYGTTPNPWGPPMPNDMTVLSMHFRFGLYPGGTYADGTGYAHIVYAHTTTSSSDGISCYGERIEQDKYYQVAVSYDMGYLYLSINGLLKQQTHVERPVWRGEPLLIGKAQGTEYPEFFKGVVDNVLACNYVMRSQQLVRLHETGDISSLFRK